MTSYDAFLCDLFGIAIGWMLCEIIRIIPLRDDDDDDDLDLHW
jgi:hypothetical protein